MYEKWGRVVQYEIDLESQIMFSILIYKYRAYPSISISIYLYWYISSVNALSAQPTHQSSLLVILVI